MMDEDFRRVGSKLTGLGFTRYEEDDADGTISSPDYGWERITDITADGVTFENPDADSSFSTMQRVAITSDQERGTCDVTISIQKSYKLLMNAEGALVRLISDNNNTQETA